MMNWKVPLSSLLLLFFVFPVAFAYETFEAVYVDGVAPMVINGDLGDWADIPASEIAVTNSVVETRVDADVIPIQGPDDLSFAFKCFADNNYVYFALIVEDNDVIVGQHSYGKGWLDDSNTLYFDGDCVDVDKPYYDANDGMLKVIGFPPDNVKYIEGLVPFFYEVQIPYFWESRGVKSGFQITETGYVTEIAIPHAVLGWDEMYAGRFMGANLRVVDMDSDVNPDEVDKGLIWAPDPEHTAHYSAQSFNRIVFSELVSMSDNDGSGAQVAVSDEGLDIILQAPDGTSNTVVVNAILEYLDGEDFSAAVSTLQPLVDELWIKPLIGIIELKNGDVQAGTDHLFQFAEECPESWGEEWVKDYIKNEAQWMYDGFKSTFTTEYNIQDKLAIMYAVLSYYTKQYPDDGEGWFVMGQCAEHLENFQSALVCYEAAEPLFQTSDDISKTRIRIAENLYFLEQYDEATTVAQLIIDSDANSTDKLSAEMILLSIESK